MTYADVTVIVDGALETEARFHDYLLMNHHIAEEQAEAISHGYPTEIYVQYHEHAEGECECAQYHHPHWTNA